MQLKNILTLISNFNLLQNVALLPVLIWPEILVEHAGKYPKISTTMSRNHLLRIFGNMPDMIYTKRYFIVLLMAAILLLGSCKKTVENISQQTVQEYFEETILNKNFVVQYAKDTANDITSNYSNDTFILKKGDTYYDGVMTGKRAGIIYTGTWSSNEDYSKLDININTPAPPATFSFLNRNWRFTKKSLPIMELAPWGTTDPKILHMRRL